MKFFQKTVITTYILATIVSLNNLDAMESKKRTLEESQETDNFGGLQVGFLNPSKKQKTVTEPEKRFVLVKPNDNESSEPASDMMREFLASNIDNDLQQPTQPITQTAPINPHPTLKKKTTAQHKKTATTTRTQAHRTRSIIKTIKENPKSTAGLITLGAGLVGVAAVTGDPVSAIAGGAGIISSLGGVAATGYRYFFPTPSEIEILQKNIPELEHVNSLLCNELKSLLAQARTNLIKNNHSVQCMHNIMQRDSHEAPLNALEAQANIQSLLTEQEQATQQGTMLVLLINKKRLELLESEMTLLELSHRLNCLLKNSELIEASADPEQHDLIHANLMQLTAKYKADKKHLLAEYNATLKRFIESQLTCNNALDGAMQR